MRILALYEFSGIVRDAFAARGHCAHSCDLLYCERDYPVKDALCQVCGQSKHFYGDIQYPPNDGPGMVRQMLWDLVLAFPPCTHLASSGARWFGKKVALQDNAIWFVKWTYSKCFRHGTKVVIENPIGVLSTHWRKPDQIIQPWQFGHGETKATCLWLPDGIPKLRPTNVVAGRHGRVWREGPSPDRWKNRSRTYQGIADAMAEQWGSL